MSAVLVSSVFWLPQSLLFVVSRKASSQPWWQGIIEGKKMTDRYSQHVVGVLMFFLARCKILAGVWIVGLGRMNQDVSYFWYKVREFCAKQKRAHCVLSFRIFGTKFANFVPTKNVPTVFGWALALMLCTLSCVCRIPTGKSRINTIL